MEIEQRLARLTPEQIRRRRRHTQELIWVCTIALVPWTIYLGLSLPADYNTRHWAVAWTGFDVLELIALAATAYFSWRRRQALIASSIVAATLLVCDAWFDITLDLGTSDIWYSVASAVLIELPLAFFLAHRATMLMRLAMVRFFPELSAQGRLPRITSLPLVFTLALDHEQQADHAAQESDTPSDPAGNPGRTDAR